MRRLHGSRRPFRGLRFDPAVVGDNAQVTAPPYDVISPEPRRLRGREPVQRGPADPGPAGPNIPQPERDGSSDYRHAADLLARWRADGVLHRDKAPCLYVYEEMYELAGAGQVSEVQASVALDDRAMGRAPRADHGGAGRRPAPAAGGDRANLSPVFGVYAGAGGPAAVLDDVTGGEPALDCVDEAGVRHRLWAVADPGRIAAWRDAWPPSAC